MVRPAGMVANTVKARIVLAVTLAAVVAAGGCSGGYDSPVGAYRVGATDRDLLLMVAMAECESLDRVEVRESAAEVRVSLLVNGGDCPTAVPKDREFPVRLVLQPGFVT